VSTRANGIKTKVGKILPKALTELLFEIHKPPKKASSTGTALLLCNKFIIEASSIASISAG